MADGRDLRARRCLAGKIARLGEELEAFLFRQFELRHRLDGDTCPGEEKCCEKGGRIFERRENEGWELPVLRVCRGGEGEEPCDALETKPSEQPFHLTDAIAAAYGLTGSGRRVYNWPDALAPIQWACIEAFERAEARFKRMLEEEREEARREQAERARLEALQRR